MQGAQCPPGGIYRAGQAIVPGWRGYRRKKGRRQNKKEKREKNKEKREKQKEKREKQGKLREIKGVESQGMCQGRTRAWEHITVITVCLGAHYSDYGALVSIFQ